MNHDHARWPERNPILDPEAWDIFELDDGRFVTVLAIVTEGTPPRSAVRYIIGAVSKQRAAADRSVRARAQSMPLETFKDILKARAKQPGAARS